MIKYSMQYILIHKPSLIERQYKITGCSYELSLCTKHAANSNPRRIIYSIEKVIISYLGMS